MRQSLAYLAHHLARLALTTLPLLLLLAGCGAKGGLDAIVCSPPCPAGSRCMAEGCVAENGPPDLAVAGVDGGGGCSPACPAATPYCNQSLVCVPCLTDDNCPRGQLCRTAGSTTLCVPGCADDARCSDGSNPALQCCDGQCLDTSSDAVNCGSCGNSCGAQHADATCVNGTCQAGACSPGWGDCDHDPSDGCEANLHVDPLNCAGCGRVCSFKNAISACSGSCYIAACVFGFDDCDASPDNGCEASVLSDVKNCGACGHPCLQTPHATVACINASCNLTGCALGWLDCDHQLVNGCETNGGTDAANCGACGNACGQGLVCKGSQCTCPQCMIPNASSLCLNNNCILDKCNLGYGDCDNDAKNGCEVDITVSPTNCGGCGIVCPQNTPYCVSGQCSASTHAIQQLAFDAHTNYNGGCGDFSQWWTQSFGAMTYEECEKTANKNGAQFMGMTGYFQWDPNGAGGANGPGYQAQTRWVGEADLNNGWIGTNNWSQLTSTPKNGQQQCVLAYANAAMHGNDTFKTTWQSMNGKTYQVNDFGIIGEKACYTNAIAAGARPLNPWMFQDAMKSTAHMVENHQNHGSCEYNGLGAYSNDGACNHNYRCLVGYNP